MRVLAGHQQAEPQHANRVAPPPTRFMTVVGQPKIIALQFATGKVVQSRFTGEQMLYTLTTGEKAYLPMHVGHAIEQLGIRAGERFSICNYGHAGWDVSRLEDSAPEQQHEPFVPPPPPPPYLPPAAHSPAPEPLPRYTSKMNAQGETTEMILARCYQSAIAITAKAVDAARASGVQFLPTHEGVQACAATLFIAATRSER